MAVFMLLEWDGVTKEQYETVRRTVNWEGNPPKGGKFHVAAFTQKGLRVTDVWESAEDFQNFVDKRLMPGTKEAKITGEPHVEVLPARRLRSRVPPALELAVSLQTHSPAGGCGARAQNSRVVGVRRGESARAQGRREAGANFSPASRLGQVTCPLAPAWSSGWPPVRLP